MQLYNRKKIGICRSDFQNVGIWNRARQLQPVHRYLFSIVMKLILQSLEDIITFLSFFFTGLCLFVAYFFLYLVSLNI